MTHSDESNTERRCKRGHLMDEANTYVDRKGKRYCRACRAAAHAAYQRERRPQSGRRHF